MAETPQEWKDRIGVGKPQPTDGRLGPTRRRTVIAEEGPGRGSPAGFQVDHKSGREDAHVMLPTLRMQGDRKTGKVWVP